MLTEIGLGCGDGEKVRGSLIFGNGAVSVSKYRLRLAGQLGERPDLFHGFGEPACLPNR